MIRNIARNIIVAAGLALFLLGTAGCKKTHEFTCSEVTYGPGSKIVTKKAKFEVVKAGDGKVFLKVKGDVVTEEEILPEGKTVRKYTSKDGFEFDLPLAEALALFGV